MAEETGIAQSQGSQPRGDLNQHPTTLPEHKSSLPLTPPGTDEQDERSLGCV